MSGPYCQHALPSSQCLRFLLIVVSAAPKRLSTNQIRTRMAVPGPAGRSAYRHLSADFAVTAAATRAHPIPVAGCASAEDAENADALGLFAGRHVRFRGCVLVEDAGSFGARLG